MAHKQMITESMIKAVKQLINSEILTHGKPPLVRDINGFIRKKYGKGNYKNLYQKLWSYIKSDKKKCCFPEFYYLTDDQGDKRLDIYATEKDI